MQSNRSKKRIVVIGAGPAGLTAARELLETDDYHIQLLERDKAVGGLARTVDYKGYKFDFGPHHFITESKHIEQWWKSLMGKNFIELQRYTRIYYNNHFFHYPLEALNVIKGLSFSECVRCVLSYVSARIRPIKPVRSFQDWITNRFGDRLFSIFFKTYTEKVWGISCQKISSDWAAHRIKTFSLGKAIFFAFFGRWFKKHAPRTLRDRFWYPTKGSGMLWDCVAQKIENLCPEAIKLNQEVISIKHKQHKIISVAASDTTKEVADSISYKADYFLSTMPLKTLISCLDPLPPQLVRTAAASLSYRGLITINLIIDKKDIFPDHWLYIHEKKVRMGRIGNMNNFSLGMVADENHTALSLEYFAFLDEPFWQKSVEELIALGTKELAMLNIAQPEQVIDGFVQRAAEAYPVYDENYKKHLDTVLNYLGTFSNLKLMGRNGLHRYNNMDQAMLSALRVVGEVIQQDTVEPKESFSESIAR